MLRWSICIFILVHLYLFLDLLEQSLSCSLTQIEIISELLHDLTGVVVFKDLDFFDVLPVKLDFQDANGLLNDWQHRIKSPHGPCSLTRWLTRLGLLRLVIRLIILWSIVRLGNLQSSLQRRLLILSLLKWRLLLNGNIKRFRSLFLLSTWRCIQEFLQYFLSLI